MHQTAGRLVFRIGDVFPAEDVVAVFLVSMSTALNDLLTTAKLLVGDNGGPPSENALSDVEQLYLLRLSFAQLHEVRESVKHAHKDEQVASFLETLPDSARRDLDRLLTVNTSQDHWIRQAMTHVRNQTSHYGGRWSWEELQWAMSRVAGDDGEIEMVNEQLIGMRLKFADHIANQHLTRKFPEYTANPNAELDEATMRGRLSALFQAMSQVTVAAQNFGTAAIDAYLDTLPVGVVRVETLPTTADGEAVMNPVTPEDEERHDRGDSNP